MNCEQYPIKKIVYLCLFDLVTLVVSFDTPLNSLKDSNASPKIKTTKEEWIMVFFSLVAFWK